MTSLVPSWGEATNEFRLTPAFLWIELMTEKLKVLIVDDSCIFRGAVEECLSGEDDVEVIGSVRNGVKAVEFMRTRRPDLVTLDMEMPDMDGLETLRAIQSFNADDSSLQPVGAIMVSGLTLKGADTTIEALEMGAFDFITKPQGCDPAQAVVTLRGQLLTKMRYFASQRLGTKMPPAPPHPSPAPRKRARSQVGAILIGVSTGGPRALVDMLPRLCRVTDLPILIVQHMPPTFTSSLAASLDAKCRATVVEGREQGVVQDGCVYLAPGGRHMLVRREGTKVVTVLNEQPPECGCRPAADVLFRSAAPVYGSKALAIILTGMGNDGCRGLAALKRVGAHVIAQDEETSVVWGMPGNAVASGHVDEIHPLMEIPEAVAAIVRQPVMEK